MATFDPQFQSQDPNFLGWSKAAQTPEADKSTGIALDTLGKGIEGAVDITDTAIKGVIKNDIDDKVDQQKTAFINQLAKMEQDRGISSNPRDANASAGDQDLMPNQAAIPAGVQQAADTVKRIGVAQAQNTDRFKATALDAQLVSTLKDVRAQYPGYRDYIDQVGKSAIGYDPANKLIADRVSELNQARSNAQAQQQYWERQLVGSGAPGADRALAQFRQDGDVTKVQNFITGYNMYTENMKQKLQQFQLSQAADNNNKTTATNAAYTVANTAASAYFFARRETSDAQTDAELKDRLTKAGLNPGTIDANEVRTIGIQMQAHMQRNYDEVIMTMKTTLNKDGKSIYDTIGPVEAGKIADESVGAVYRGSQKLLSDNNTGLLFATQNYVGDMKNQDIKTAANAPEIGPFMRTAMVVNNAFPNLSAPLQQQLWGTPQGQGLVSGLQSVLQAQKIAAAAGTDGNGGTPTFAGHQANLQRAQQAGNLPDQARAAGIKDLMGLTKMITEKDPEIQDRGITYFYDPQNRGVLNKFMDDYYDTSRGRIMKGRTDAFDTLTDHKITDSIYKRARSGGGSDQWLTYKQWATDQGSSMLTTMAKTWNQNETKAANQSDKLTGIPTGTDHHFYWDTDRNQIGITDLKGTPLDIDKTWRLNPDIFMVRNANIILHNLAHVAETEGTDTNAYLFQVMKDAGWATPSLERRGSGASTISDRIIKSVVVGNTKPEPKKNEP